MRPEPLLVSLILNNKFVILVVILVVMITAIILLVFILLREYFCWYWKINNIVNLLESIDKQLNGISKHDEKNEISNESTLKQKRLEEI